MNKIISLAIVLLCLVPFVITVSHSSSINWASHRYLAENYCEEDGDCVFANLNVSNITITGNTTTINTTITNYNVTNDLDVGGDADIAGNLSVAGNTSSSWFFGYLNFSWIQDWDWDYIYSGLWTLIRNDFYNESEVDDLISSDTKWAINETVFINNSDTLTINNTWFTDTFGGGSGNGTFQNRTDINITRGYADTMQVYYNLSVDEIRTYRDDSYIEFEDDGDVVLWI